MEPASERNLHWLRDLLTQASLQAEQASANTWTHMAFNGNGSEAAFLTDISSGTPAMDQLHHDVFQALDQLSTVPDQEFAARFGAFVHQLEQAFLREEEWMEEVELPSHRPHQEQHARVLGALHNVHMRVMEGNLGLGREVTDQLLPLWFAFHMSTMDTTLAHAMQSRAAINKARSRRAPTLS
ncbi:hemerythrin-like metal-binding domain protein [Noviherbaspirillum humi]|uniref:Hemerythrin-like metal-binding domain protein n=1 Tax=Noviherbaspirillum humi TaxID=1688639 RepID=A0A239LSJ9_9BURK|nr:hypothetical protein [Noviherbaspirillum humi]SNT32783.1 hemerythrin-like metal-binding domain protein [Noviherbaspirillum humi]